MKNLRNQKGITLVALVVTIIVLLILAGVSLSLVAGSEGILGKASNAVDKNQIATIKERVDMKVAEEVENYYEAKYVDRTIDNSTTALQYISGQAGTNHINKLAADNSNQAAVTAELENRHTWSDGNANYQIVYAPATITSTTTSGTIYVIYSKNKTKISGESKTGYNTDPRLTGTITANGAITWESDKANS